MNLKKFYFHTSKRVMGIMIRPIVYTVFFCAILFLVVQKSIANDNPWFADKDKLVGNTFHIEFLGGGFMNFMHYTSDANNEISTQNPLLLETGLIFRFQRGKWFSWLPGVRFLQQGTTITEPEEYNFNANYLTLSLPVEWAFDFKSKYKKNTSKFLVFAGPYVASPLSGSIYGEEFQEDIFKNSIKDICFGIEGGVGIRVQTFSLEDKSNVNLRLSWMQGFNDTFSPEEKTFASNPNYGQFTFLNGKRIASGIKLTLSIEVSFTSKRIVSFTAGGDGKKNYKKFVIIDEK
ncbi:MAG: outer membrane beta-barrel protein [Prolixibacteraceae bacterium]|nr:outer membrane beta-barrel protein [Prolixibacteraceae bacterium]